MVPTTTLVCASGSTRQTLHGLPRSATYRFPRSSPVSPSMPDGSRKTVVHVAPLPAACTGGRPSSLLRTPWPNAVAAAASAAHAPSQTHLHLPPICPPPRTRAGKVELTDLFGVSARSDARR